MVYDQNVEVARHERLIAKCGIRLELDHYLEALVRKPGVFPGVTALEQARSAGRFTPVHDAWWAAARKVHGERDGTRALPAVFCGCRRSGLSSPTSRPSAAKDQMTYRGSPSC
ncbi:hypothetical protein [Streptomyces sp. NPDC059013]|uniref:hypothetical protein n=1 Tax=unclassified Streptomyces TaxID=2593676 RepID=UPI0036D06AC3